jgi:hypothetical protein
MKSKKKKLSLLFLAPLLLILQGCPYQSKVPISEVGESVQKNLLGTYFETKDIDKPIQFRDRYEINKEKNNQLLINKLTYSEYDKKWSGEVFIAHLSEVNNEQFLNLKKVDEIETENDNNESLDENDNSESLDNISDEKFYLYKIYFDGAILKIKGISKNITEEFTDSKSLQDFISKNQDKSFFYEKDDEISLIHKDKLD